MPKAEWNDKLNKVSGCNAYIDKSGNFLLVDGQDEPFGVFRFTKGKELQEAIEEAYKHNGAIAMRRDNNKCVRCGSRRNLQRHHDKRRSKGRDDRPENLITLCADCHEREHSGS